MLSNLKILDFSSLLPGPFATMFLGDLGAEIVYICRADDNKQPFNEFLERNKSIVHMDLKSNENIEKIKELIMDYDIVVEQFRPGVMERLGLSYEQLRTINPKLIYCSITGYGQNGSYASRAGHDINYLSIAGIPSHSGSINDKPPSLGVQIADLAGGSMFAVSSILAAVNYRHIKGIGQHIDISMTDCTAALNIVSMSDYLKNGKIALPESNELNGRIFYDYYETKDGRYFSIGSLEEKFLKNLFQILNIPLESMADAYSFDSSKCKAIKELIAERIKLKTFAEWQVLFSATDACVEPVLTFEEMEKHPHYNDRQLFVDVQLADGRMSKQYAHPVKYSAYEPKYHYQKDNVDTF